MGELNSNILAAEVGFLTGMASSMNLRGDFYHFKNSANETEADCKAIALDWALVGQDIAQSINRVNADPERCLEVRK